jgi:hypothetical protein
MLILQGAPQAPYRLQTMQFRAVCAMRGATAIRQSIASRPFQE